MTHEVFRRRLREERARSGLSQSALAAALGRLLQRHLDPSAVARMEAGERSVRLEEAVAAAEVLGLPLGALLRDRDAIDDEIGELERDLSVAEWETSQAAEAHRTARDSAVGLRRRIAELRAIRGD
ncbi:helix-turn-helix domain-containing protein [Serinibacter arcticus]|nr:helix-turn-helix domain-containing protein [Serinibacter arcticus]